MPFGGFVSTTLRYSFCKKRLGWEAANIQLSSGASSTDRNMEMRIPVSLSNFFPALEGLTQGLIFWCIFSRRVIVFGKQRHPIICFIPKRPIRSICKASFNFQQVLADRFHRIFFILPADQRYFSQAFIIQKPVLNDVLRHVIIDQ